MRIVHVLVTGMRVRACNHVHPKLPASRDDFAERVHRPEPSASIVEWDLSRIESDNASGTQTSRIGMGRSYHPTETSPIESLASEEEEARAALFTANSVKHAVVNPAACLINVLLLFPIYGSS